MDSERLRIAEERLGENYTSREFLQVACDTFNPNNKKYFSELAKTLSEDELRGEDDQEVSDDEHDEVNQPVFRQDEDDVEVTLTQPQAAAPTPEPPRCPVCYSNELNAVFECGHQCCVDCAERIKAHSKRVRRISHICRAPVKRYIQLRGSY